MENTGEISTTSVLISPQIWRVLVQNSVPKIHIRAKSELLALTVALAAHVDLPR